jgi:hypothetical protein
MHIYALARVQISSCNEDDDDARINSAVTSV